MNPPPSGIISHLTAGRSQIGTSLSFHLFFAVLGVGLPLMMIVAEGMAFGPLGLMIVNLRPAAFVTLLGGLWLAVSPWVLGYATEHAAWLNELVTGLLLIAICASAGGVRVSPLRLAGHPTEVIAEP